MPWWIGFTITFYAPFPFLFVYPDYFGYSNISVLGACHGQSYTRQSNDFPFILNNGLGNGAGKPK
jgi:hypothetical protein